jgi:hypothetical protein
MNRITESRLISMTFWYPLLLSAQHNTQNPVPEFFFGDKHIQQRAAKPSPVVIRVPDTVIIQYPYGSELYKILDGVKIRGWDYLIDSLDRAAQELGGYPIFLRTETSSDKHSWKDSCFVESKDKLPSHIGALVEHSAMHDLDCGFFAVRKLIDTAPICTAFYGDMPIAKERRLFVKDGKVICNHPYWPEEAFRDHEDKLTIDVEALNRLQELADGEEASLNAMGELVSQYVSGHWSVDFLQDKEGQWWCIDMALASSSYHWEGCKAQPS